MDSPWAPLRGRQHPRFRTTAPPRGSGRLPGPGGGGGGWGDGRAKSLRGPDGCRHNAGVRVARSVTAVVIAALTGCGAELDPNQLRDAAAAPDVVDAEVVDAPADARACEGGDARVVSNGACLVVYRTPATYAGAQAACASLSARLVVIASAQTNQSVTTPIGGVQAFVGPGDPASVWKARNWGTGGLPGRRAGRLRGRSPWPGIPARTACSRCTRRDRSPACSGLRGSSPRGRLRRNRCTCSVCSSRRRRRALGAFRGEVGGAP